MMFNLSLFSLVAWVFGIKTKKFMHNQRSQRFTPIFPAKSFLPFCGLSFHSLHSVLWCTEFSYFDEVQCIYFFFYSLCCIYSIISKNNCQNKPPKITAKSNVMKISSMLSSKSFYNFRVLIQFELTFVYFFFFWYKDWTPKKKRKKKYM